MSLFNFAPFFISFLPSLLFCFASVFFPLFLSFSFSVLIFLSFYFSILPSFVVSVRLSFDLSIYRSINLSFVLSSPVSIFLSSVFILPSILLSFSLSHPSLFPSVSLSISLFFFYQSSSFLLAQWTLWISYLPKISDSLIQTGKEHLETGMNLRLHPRLHFPSFHGSLLNSQHG